MANELFDLSDKEALQGPIALSMGIRQFVIGLMIVVLVLAGQIKALGYIMLIGAIVPLTDFFVFSPVIGWVSSLRHGATVPMILVLGLYLLVSEKRTA